MLLDICFGTKTAWKILFVLAEAPGKAVSRKQIKSLTKLGNKVLTKFLLLLEKFDMLIVQKIGKTFLYKLNLSNPFVEKILEIIKLEKKALNNLDFYILTILREFVYEMTNIHLSDLRQIYLFGSYAKRTYHKDSDIDVALILEKKDVNNELLVTQAISKLQARFKKEIQVHYYTEKEFNRKNQLAEEILRDGIKLM